MIGYSLTGERAAGVTESWKVSPDGKIWDVYLRKGIKWHNGDTLTSQDAVIGVERMRRPEISAGLPVSGLLEPLEKFEAVDDYHLRYHFKEPYALFPLYADLVPPVPKKYIEKVCADGFANDTPAGTGQFISATKVKRGTSTRLRCSGITMERSLRSKKHRWRVVRTGRLCRWKTSSPGNEDRPYGRNAC